MTEISETSNPTAAVVLYDDACGMCLRTVAWLKPWLEPRGFRFEPFPAGVEKFEMKVSYPDGRVLGGADAVVGMARAIGWLRPLTWLTLLPGVMPLAAGPATGRLPPTVIASAGPAAGILLPKPPDP